jgi:hypothetical protein
VARSASVRLDSGVAAAVDSPRRMGAAMLAAPRAWAWLGFLRLRRPRPRFQWVSLRATAILRGITEADETGRARL